jgi:hypothetical protein
LWRSGRRRSGRRKGGGRRREVAVPLAEMTACIS